MTLPNPRVDYRVDPTGTDERLRVSMISNGPGVNYGLVNLRHAILAGANRHAQRYDARHFKGRLNPKEPRHG